VEEATFRDAADLVAKERRRRLKSLALGGAAVVVTAGWVVVVETWSRKARSHGPLTEAYYWGYSVAPLLICVLLAALVCAFPGRSWTRFFATYAISGTLGLLTQVKSFLDFPARERAMEAAAQRASRGDALLRENQRLVAELNETPPFSAAAIASEEAIAASENRLESMQRILGSAAEVVDEARAARPHVSRDVERDMLVRQQRAAQAEAYRASQTTLKFLRTSFGRWTVQGAIVQFSLAYEQERFNELLQAAQDAEKRAADLQADLDERAPPPRP
jgi:hypothetical protein